MPLDMPDLPYALAKYLQDSLYKVVDYIPTPSQQRLDADMLFRILGHVRPYGHQGASESNAQLAIFSHIKITHPRSDVHVRFDHACPNHCQLDTCETLMSLTFNRAMTDDAEGVPVATHAVPRQNLQ